MVNKLGEDAAGPGAGVHILRPRAIRQANVQTSLALFQA
jgi:hypothetical protein